MFFYFQQGDSTVIAKARGFDRTLELLGDRVRADLTRGLATPLINVSYAGDLATIRAHPVFSALERDAQAQGITVLLSTMSVTGCINVGPGALALSYIAGPPMPAPVESGAEAETGKE